MQILASLCSSLCCGLMFGAGLQLSGMTQPAKVLGFLDVLGRWDPTLAFVMAGALAVSAAGFVLVRRSGRPVLVPVYLWPTAKDIDRPLVAGAVLFGVGWGLSGLCPGPALENLANLSPRIAVFVAAMIAGMAVHAWWQGRVPAPESPGPRSEAALPATDG